jgi:hypothetical protein
MDKDTFASYKFKPGDVIEGLNRYFAAKRYLRDEPKSLEIRRGVCYSNPDCVKDIIFSNDPPERTTKAWRCWNYYLVCDPEEVVGVAINWLREEHDIFYTPGMEVPGEDFDVDEAAKEYEKATRKDILCEENLDVVPVARVREALGIAEDSDIFQCIKYRNNKLETLRTELAESRRMHHNDIDERNKFGRRLMEIRKASGMADDDHGDLVNYIETLRKCEEEYEYLYKQYERMYCELRDAKFTNLSEERDHYKWLYENLKNEILKVYREIFDCSNGDPEGSDAEVLQDILTEYQRCLKLKDVAEEKSIRYSELDRYKWLYMNLKYGVESVLQEAEEKED